MSAPSSDHDLLIEIKTLVKALTEIVTGYGKDIRTHDAKLEDHGQRIVALETQTRTNDANTNRGISRRAAFWTAVSALAVIASVTVAVVVAIHAAH